MELKCRIPLHRIMLNKIKFVGKASDDVKNIVTTSKIRSEEKGFENDDSSNSENSNDYGPKDIDEVNEDLEDSDDNGDGNDDDLDDNGDENDDDLDDNGDGNDDDLDDNGDGNDDDLDDNGDENDDDLDDNGDGNDDDSDYNGDGNDDDSRYSGNEDVNDLEKDDEDDDDSEDNDYEDDDIRFRNNPTSREKKLIHSPKCRGRARKASTPYEFWSLLFPDKLLEIIVEHTNEEIRDWQQDAFLIEPYYRETNLIEIKAFIGLLYYAGLKRDNYKDTNTMWQNKEAIYRSTMNRKRFQILGSCLRFGNRTTREDRQTDRLVDIREIWDMFMENCGKYIIPSQHCVVDKQLLKFRGKFPMKVHIKNKPDTSGIKILCLCDSESSYMLNAIPYTGKISSPRLENVPTVYLRQLSTPIHGTGRNIICGKWFSSVELVNIMKRDLSLTVVGMMRKDNPEIPKSLRQPKNDMVYVRGSDAILLSYTPEENEFVCFTSSLHKDLDETDSNAENLQNIISFYKRSKNAVSRFDLYCKSYSTSRDTMRSTMRLFFGMLDQGVANSWILYHMLKRNEMKILSKFINELITSLTMPYMENRLEEDFPEHSAKEFDTDGTLRIDDDLFNLRLATPQMIKCMYCENYVGQTTVPFCCHTCANPICEDHAFYTCAPHLDCRLSSIPSNNQM